MGAQQSSARDGAVPNHEASKTCYYELLGVELQATEDEIKRAYRKRALELHPDRNLGDVEASTRKFAEVQTAYEVLSDPQERAWYDSHRDAILRGQDQTGDGDEPATFRNVRLTSTEEILALMRKFNANVPFNDEPTGFFGITHETFEHLALEEEAAAEAENIDCPHYPGFGSSDDLYDSVVKSFYNAWAGFSTRKTFAWKDKYRLSDAPDRRVRRLMEKENKKCREDAIREFNDAVRFLVSFVRKRDPRYIPNLQTDTERQKSIRDAAAAQAARSRAAHQEKLASYEMPEWVQRKDDDPAAHEFSEPDEEGESEIEILECVICKKTFKSDKQLEAHERSKKHAKAIQQLRREMRKEGIELDLDSGSNSSIGLDRGSGKAERSNRDVSTQGQADGETMPVSLDTLVPESSKDVPSELSSPRPEAQESLTDGSESELADTTDYASRQEVENRLTLDRSIRRASSHAVTVGQSENDPLVTAMSDILVDGHGSAPKIGKAKAKRERKAATTRLPGNEQQCSVCTETFASRTKLFNHIREMGHATAIPQTKFLGKQVKRR